MTREELLALMSAEDRELCADLPVDDLRAMYARKSGPFELRVERKFAIVDPPKRRS